MDLTNKQLAGVLGAVLMAATLWLIGNGCRGSCEDKLNCGPQIWPDGGSTGGSGGTGGSAGSGGIATGGDGGGRGGVAECGNGFSTQASSGSLCLDDERDDGAGAGGTQLPIRRQHQARRILNRGRDTPTEERRQASRLATQRGQQEQITPHRDAQANKLLRQRYREAQARRRNGDLGALFPQGAFKQRVQSPVHCEPRNGGNPPWRETCGYSDHAYPRAKMGHIEA